VVVGRGLAQEMTLAPYTDPKTGIKFNAWTAPLDSEGHGAFTFGMAVSEEAATKDATEYIGLLVRLSTYYHHARSYFFNPIQS
jgi:hypothetical protein